MSKAWAPLAGVVGLVLAVGAAQAASVTYRATLNGASEIPPTTSTGTGNATVTVDTTAKTATWNVTFSGLSGPATAAHIHCAPAPGQAGPVAVPFTGTPTAAPAGTLTGSTEKPLSDQTISDMAAGKCYVNVHTAANKGGEIAGWLKP
jgi:hypothetical protein